MAQAGRDTWRGTIAPPAPAGTIAAFAVTSPVGAFSVEDPGCPCPAGHALMKPRGPDGTVVIFSANAWAVAGIPQTPVIGKLRVVLAASEGPPYEHPAAIARIVSAPFAIHLRGGLACPHDQMSFVQPFRHGELPAPYSVFSASSSASQRLGGE